MGIPAGIAVLNVHRIFPFLELDGIQAIDPERLRPCRRNAGTAATMPGFATVYCRPSSHATEIDAVHVDRGIRRWQVRAKGEVVRGETGRRFAATAAARAVGAADAEVVCDADG